MKKILPALALSLCSTAAMADIINFEGTVSAGGTCAIEVVTPGGPGLPVVHLGNYNANTFTAVGQETPKRYFALRVPAGCATPPESGYATFSAGHGADPVNPDLYALQDGIGYSSGLGLAINDVSTRLKPGVESAAYALSDTTPTDMVFSTRLVTTKATVTEGQIASNVSFLVDIR